MLVHLQPFHHRRNFLDRVLNFPHSYQTKFIYNKKIKIMTTVQPELKEEDTSLGGLGNIMLILGIGGYGIIGSILAKYNVTNFSIFI
jgi:hypothetical protein